MDSHIFKYDKTDPNYSKKKVIKEVNNVIENRLVYKLREFENKKELCVAVIWED